MSIDSIFTIKHTAPEADRQEKGLPRAGVVLIRAARGIRGAQQPLSSGGD
jgi:hypothetical protein